MCVDALRVEIWLRKHVVLIIALLTVPADVVLATPAQVRSIRVVVFVGAWVVISMLPARVAQAIVQRIASVADALAPGLLRKSLVPLHSGILPAFVAVVTARMKWGSFVRRLIVRSIVAVVRVSVEVLCRGFHRPHSLPMSH